MAAHFPEIKHKCIKILVGQDLLTNFELHRLKDNAVLDNMRILIIPIQIFLVIYFTVLIFIINGQLW